MKLLRTDLSEIVTIPSSSKPPPFAIISHVWGDDELSYSQLCPFSSGGRIRPDPSVLSWQGYIKVKLFAEIAASNGYDYIWIDTCCIDKTSSAELSAAINSMYKYYQDAEVCYVYLRDLTWTTSRKEISQDLPHCRWFTRAWTLQELIAPRDIIIYDCNLVPRNMFEPDTLAAVAARTGIPVSVLEKQVDIKDINIATKMTWAAGRVATHEEDIAYSLFGIFDVNMSLLYGEGAAKAFVRLQKEIIANSNDETIFAWASSAPAVFGLFAESPHLFQSCLGLHRRRPSDGSASPWVYWAGGLRVSLAMLRNTEWPDERSDVYLGWFDPATGMSPSFVLLRIGNAWVRQGPLSWKRFPGYAAGASHKEVFVRQQSYRLPKLEYPKFKFKLPPDFDKYFLVESTDPVYWSEPTPSTSSGRESLTNETKTFGSLVFKHVKMSDMASRVTARTHWDAAMLAWTCETSIDAGLHGSFAPPDDTAGSLISDGVYEAIYRGKDYGVNGYQMIASVRHRLPWDYQGPIFVYLRMEMLPASKLADEDRTDEEQIDDGQIDGGGVGEEQSDIENAEADEWIFV